MSEVRRLVAQLAVAKAVADQAKTVADQVKERLGESMDAGDRKTAVVGGRDVGTVSYAKTSAEAVVVDVAAFTAWAEKTAPGKVRWPVTVDAEDVALSADWLTGSASGDAWHRLQDAARERLARPGTVDPYWQADVLRTCVRLKAAVYEPTGEEIPGVRYSPGGVGKYVSARVSPDQLARLQDAYLAGEVDLLALASIPPEIEATP